MENMPTAEDFLRKNIDYVLEKDCKEDVEQAMIEFAKLHVEAALKEVSEKKTHGMLVVPLFNEHQRDVIVNSYPLDKIK